MECQQGLVHIAQVFIDLFFGKSMHITASCGLQVIFSEFLVEGIIIGPQTPQGGPPTSSKWCEITPIK